MKVCVFCASSSRCDRVFLDEAEKLGSLLAKSGRTIIYGGGKVGSMGRLAEGALTEGGSVIGIIPTLLHKLELGHDKIEELREVADMHKRESMMLLESDAILVLPGGTGTIEELMQAITWKHLGIIISPIIVMNLNGYYDLLFEMLKKSINEKFMTEEFKSLWSVVNNAEEMMTMLDNF